MKKNNNSKHVPEVPEPQHEDDEVKKKKKSLQETLTASLQMLKIDHDDSQISETAFKLTEKATNGEIKIYGYWIMSLNAVADSYLATKHIEDENERRTKAIDNTVFGVYKDIMTNYQLK
jgi:hypothetical protein